MKRLLIGLLAAALVTGCGVEESVPPSVQPAVVERIASTTDCAALQEEFDVAELHADRLRDAGALDEARRSTYYMRLAHERMGSIGCYS